MSFVPVFVPPPPSPRAKRLAGEIERTITDFRRKEPGTADGEVRRALQLAGRRAAGDSEKAIVLILAVVMLLGGVFFLLRDSGVGSGPDGDTLSSWWGPALIAGVLLVVFAVVLKKHR